MTYKYTITNKILQNIKEINKIVTELDNKRFPKPILYKITTDSRNLSVHASTSIEGNNLSLTQVKRLIQNNPKNIQDTEREILNYNQALQTLNQKIKEKKVQFDNKLILDTHKQVVNKLLENHLVGKYRKDTVIVQNPLTQEIVYLPPDYNDVKDLMKDLITYVNENEDEIDPLILAGIFHKQFVLIHPFMDGNGRTCRLVTKVLLAKLGLDTFELFSFENFYNQNISKYFSIVGEYGDYYERSKNLDFTQWLEYFTEGIKQETYRVRDILENRELTPEYMVLKDQSNMIEYIQMNGFITDKKYSDITQRAKATRVIDFNKLIDMDIIERKGKGRNTYYTLKY